MKLLFFSFLLSGALFMASCSDNETEEATLSLSELALEFPKDASEKSVTITTNQSKLSIMPSSEWIEVLQSGQTLTVNVKVNLNGASRNGSILILAGGISKNISVTQSGAGINIDAIPDKLGIDQWGGKRSFDVDTNIDDWSVETDAEWITLKKNTHLKNVVMQIAENKERGSRSATIIIKADSVAKEFIIEQSGIMYFMVPYLNFGARTAEIELFEKNRNSDCTNIKQNIVSYITKSPACQKIDYIFSKVEDTYMGAVVYCQNFAEIGKDSRQELEVLFKENGFEPTTVETVFFKKGTGKYGVEANIIYGSPPTINYTLVEEQPKPYATFEALPSGLYDFNAEKSAIVNWEKENGGTFNAKYSKENDENSSEDFLWYDVNDGKLLARAYNTDRKTKKLVQTLHYYTDMHLCLWNGETKNYPTREFVALAEKAGYKYVEIYQGFHIFDHSEKGIVMALEALKYKEYPDSLAVIRVVPRRAPNTTTKEMAKGFIK